MPATLSVAKAGTISITVKNNGSITHALSVKTPGGVLSTGSIAPGSSTTLKVQAAKPGRYSFFCPIANHAQLGMKGVLVVGGATSGGAPAATQSTQPSPPAPQPSSGSSYGGY
jgi:uncharacterized cupredoxin-like copper-binding protein